MSRKYQLINYFDVWGNAKDGWEVNNMCVEEENLWLDDDCTDKEIANYLAKIGYLTTSDMRRLYFENLGGITEIYEKKGMKPLYSLREVV